MKGTKTMKTTTRCLLLAAALLASGQAVHAQSGAGPARSGPRQKTEDVRGQQNGPNSGNGAAVQNQERNRQRNGRGANCGNLETNACPRVSEPAGPGPSGKGAGQGNGKGKNRR